MHAWIGNTFIEWRLALGSGVAGGTHARVRVRTVDAHATIARMRQAVIDVGAAVDTSETIRTHTRVRVKRVNTLAVYTRVREAFVQF